MTAISIKPHGSSHIRCDIHIYRRTAFPLRPTPLDFPNRMSRLVLSSAARWSQSGYISQDGSLHVHVTTG